MKLLLVEDERKVARFIVRGLTDLGYDVTSVQSAKNVDAMMDQFDFDLVLLDVMIRDGDGHSVARRLRGAGYTGPILMLTALSGTKDKIKGLDSGADDYLTKPFDFDELAARIRALLRRGAPVTQSILTCGDLALDVVSRKATRAGQTIELSAKEFSLLEYLMRHTGHPVSRQTLGEKVWGVRFELGSNVIDVYVNYLRKKVDQAFSSKLIHTVTGVGYVLKET